MKTFEEFLATQKEDLNKGIELMGIEDVGFSKIFIFAGDCMVHQYEGDYSYWVVIGSTEEDFDTLEKAAHYLYQEWYVTECAEAQS